MCIYIYFFDNCFIFEVSSGHKYTHNYPLYMYYKLLPGVTRVEGDFQVSPADPLLLNRELNPRGMLYLDPYVKK